jgi:hypothetical protein
MKKSRERQGMPLSVENTLSRHPDSLIATCPHDGRKRSMEFPYQAAWSSGVSKEEKENVPDESLSDSQAIRH